MTQSGASGEELTPSGPPIHIPIPIQLQITGDVQGQSNGFPLVVGVYGISLGDSPAGVYGVSQKNDGVSGYSTSGVGVHGESQQNNGISGLSQAAGHSGVYGNNTSSGVGVAGSITSGIGVQGTSNSGTGLWAKGTPAGYFEGDVNITGDVILVNASSGDVAEDFDLEDDPINGDPGTVLVINSNGKLCASVDPYDTRVAGVVSGAGGLTPAVVLQRLESCRQRSPIALVGKAFCKVDASFGCITAGDLLTTSSTLGHAMKVFDHTRASGAIIGKALGGLADGQGLIPILVSPR